MKKPPSSILIEAIVVGILLIIVYHIVDKSFTYDNNVILFISGALFHILCEISGVNLWYVHNYNEILQK